MNPDIVGWAASAILLATLSRQIITQWQDKDAKGALYVLMPMRV